jgi:oligopeptide/dipeptide ABC transporter ATP-binding protein
MTGDRTQPVLQVQHLVKHFPVRRGVFGKQVGAVHAVDDVTFDLYPGRSLGLVGESGSGKTTTGRAIMRLIEPSSGTVQLGDLTVDRHTDRRRLARDMSMVFQDPLGSLNPRLSAVANVAEPLRVQGIGNASERRARATELLGQVGLRADQVERVPAEFSGGMCQRVVIAMAIANNPKVIIADEPTTAVDVTVQAQLLEWLRVARHETGAAVVLITHDLGVVAEVAERVAVMYAGRVVETAPVRQIFHAPRHPYTVGLLSCLPRLDRTVAELAPIPGSPPDLRETIQGCPFQPRCELSGGRDICRTTRPPLVARGDAAASACHFADAVPGWARHRGTVVEPV